MNNQITTSLSKASAKTTKMKLPKSAKVRLGDLRPKNDPKGGLYRLGQGSAGASAFCY